MKKEIFTLVIFNFRNAWYEILTFVIFFGSVSLIKTLEYRHVKMRKVRLDSATTSTETASATVETDFCLELDRLANETASAHLPYDDGQSIYYSSQDISLVEE